LTVVGGVLVNSGSILGPASLEFVAAKSTPNFVLLAVTVTS